MRNLMDRDQACEMAEENRLECVKEFKGQIIKIIDSTINSGQFGCNILIPSYIKSNDVKLICKELVDKNYRVGFNAFHIEISWYPKRSKKSNWFIRLFK